MTSVIPREFFIFVIKRPSGREGRRTSNRRVECQTIVEIRRQLDRRGVVHHVLYRYNRLDMRRDCFRVLQRAACIQNYQRRSLGLRQVEDFGERGGRNVFDLASAIEHQRMVRRIYARRQHMRNIGAVLFQKTEQVSRADGPARCQSKLPPARSLAA
jgi:hypothetical protein